MIFKLPVKISENIIEKDNRSGTHLTGVLNVFMKQVNLIKAYKLVRLEIRLRIKGKEKMIDAKRKVSAAEYEKLPEGPPQQLINGEIIMSPAPSSYHQMIIGEVYSSIKEFVKKNNLGKVLLSPIDVKLSELDVFQPDIIYISKERKEIIKENIIGAPDLVIEVLSPSNAYYDLTHKKNIYEETGVREFWIVDPDEKFVEVYENLNGTFVLFSKAKGKGAIKSKLLFGLTVQIETLFAEL